MERNFVSSSNLASVGYDENTQTLDVEFRSGWVYRYFNVSAQIYAQLMTASSKGVFFNTYIKDAHAFTRIA